MSELYRCQLKYIGLDSNEIKDVTCIITNKSIFLDFGNFQRILLSTIIYVGRHNVGKKNEYITITQGGFGHSAGSMYSMSLISKSNEESMELFNQIKQALLNET